jgi:hypothetical protein
MKNLLFELSCAKSFENGPAAGVWIRAILGKREPLSSGFVRNGRPAKITAWIEIKPAEVARLIPSISSNFLPFGAL